MIVFEVQTRCFCDPDDTQNKDILCLEEGIIRHKTSCISYDYSGYFCVGPKNDTNTTTPHFGMAKLCREGKVLMDVLLIINARINIKY